MNLALVISLVIFAINFDATLTADTVDKYTKCAALINEILGNRYNPTGNDQQVRQILIPPTTPVVVKTGLTVVMVKDIEAEEQKLTLTVLVSMEWEDERIVPEDETCKTVTSQYVIESTRYLPWYPHFVVANSASTVLYEDGWRYFPSVVFANGTVRWIQEYQIQTICILDLAIFPFDNQFCTIQISSPHYNEETVEYEVEHDDLAVQIVSQEAAQAAVWKLVGQSYEYLKETPGIAFKLEFERGPGFYICSLMLPTLVVNMMTAATFLLGPVFEEKAQAAQSCLLAYMLLYLVFYTFVPASSNSQPYLVAFFALQNFLGLGCFFATCMIFRREHEIKLNEEAVEKREQAGQHEEEEEQTKFTLKGIFNDLKSLNDFVFIGYIAVVAATYVATVIFIMLGSIQLDAKAAANGYTAPKVITYTPGI